MAGNPVRQEGEGEEEEGGEGQMDQGDQHVARYRSSYICSILRIRNPMLFWPLDPGWVKNQDPNAGRYRTWVRDELPRSYIRETIFWVKIFKFFDADPGWKKFGCGINIPDPLHCCFLQYRYIFWFISGEIIECCGRFAFVSRDFHVFFQTVFSRIFVNCFTCRYFLGHPTVSYVLCSKQPVPIPHTFQFLFLCLYKFLFSFRYEGGEEEERDVFEELAARGAAAGAPAIPVSQPPHNQPTITEVRARRSSDEDFLCQKFTEMEMNKVENLLPTRVC
jgi:hypothetical protein